MVKRRVVIDLVNNFRRARSHALKIGGLVEVELNLGASARG